MIVPTQHEYIVFDVLADPYFGCVVEECSEAFEYGKGFLAVGRAGNIPAFVWLNCKAQSYQLRFIGIDTCCFGIETDFLVARQFLNKAGNSGRALYQYIFVGGIVYVALCCGSAVFDTCCGVFGGSGYCITKEVGLYACCRFFSRCGFFGRCITQQAFAQGFKFQLAENVFQLIFIYLLDAEIFFMKFYRHICNDCSQFFAHYC